MAADDRIVHIVTDRRDLGVGGSWNLWHDPSAAAASSYSSTPTMSISTENTLQSFYDNFMKQRRQLSSAPTELTDINKNILPPGKIDHASGLQRTDATTPAHQRSRCSSCMYSPLLRDITMPNVNYGEDYAFMLALSRRYLIGRIYDPVY
jgi:hypothetical protein